MKCVIVGLGEFGRAAAVGLARAGAEVIAVDTKMERVNLVKDEVALAIKLDGRQRDELKSHGIGDADVLVAAIGEDFEAQVLLIVHARKLGIKRIVARATSMDHRRVLEAVGADEVFNPEEEAAHWMVRRLTITNISNYYELAEGFSIVEAKAPPGITGKTLRDLDLRRRFRINLVAIKKVEIGPEGEESLKSFNPVPLPDEVIQPNDVLALLGSVLDLASFMGEYS